MIAKNVSTVIQMFRYYYQREKFHMWQKLTIIICKSLNKYNVVEWLIHTEMSYSFEKFA